MDTRSPWRAPRPPEDPGRASSGGRPPCALHLGALRLGSLSVFLNAENLLDVRQTRFDPLVRDRRAPDGRWTVGARALEGFVVNGGIRIRLGGGDQHDDDHHH